MSTLACYLEDEGLATTTIALVREHAVKAEPPRALWVPFELGRPLGPPNDTAFQQRVLRACLELLLRTDGPVVLDDFPDQAPNSEADPGWRNPVALPAFADASGAALEAALEREIQALAGAYETSRHSHGRTGYGLTGLDPAALGRYLAARLAGEDPESPIPGYSRLLATRFAIDDLKAYYLEAASGGGAPSSRQLVEWFWDRTVAAQIIIALRARFRDSDDRREQSVGGLFLVPRVQVDRLGLPTD